LAHSKLHYAPKGESAGEPALHGIDPLLGGRYAVSMREDQTPNMSKKRPSINLPLPAPRAVD
jgi:hypothetical protein